MPRYGRFALIVGLLAVTASVALSQTGGSTPRQTAPNAPVKLPPKIQKLEKEYLAAKRDYKRNPKNKKAEERFVKAATIYGHECMVSPDLPARVKYRMALRAYREVLEIEPNHPVARPEHDLIVSIYKQMGLPVPK